MNYFNLINGQKIPQIGLGTYDLKANTISSALRMGYRLVDTAWQYGNEKEVGNAIRQSGICREEIFITTKLWTEHIRNLSIRDALEESLKNLGLDYVDLYLIHWPAYGYEKAWEMMIKLRDEGKIRNIGVSNFTIDQLKKINNSGVSPAINQVESHPYFRNDEIINFCRKESILPQAWCPIGGSYSNLKNEILFQEISDKYKKTVVQIIIRWHIQRNVLLIPRTQHEERLIENLNVFDFELDESDMEKINTMDSGKRLGADPDNFNF